MFAKLRDRRAFLAAIEVASQRTTRRINKADFDLKRTSKNFSAM